MSGWEDEPPEVVRVLRERELDGAELQAERVRLLRAWGWAPRRVVKRRLLMTNGRLCDDWTYHGRVAAKEVAA